MALRRRDVADRLHSAAIHLLRRLREADAESELSPARLSALSVLVFGGPRTLGDLAKAEGVTAPTITRLVQSLERDGLVKRRRDPGDGRAIVLAASERGARILKEGRARRLDAFERLLTSADIGDLETLNRAALLVEALTSR